MEKININNTKSGQILIWNGDDIEWVNAPLSEAEIKRAERKAKLEKLDGRRINE